MTLYFNYVSFFVNSVKGNSLSDEGRATLEMMEDEMNSKRGPDEHKLRVKFDYVFEVRLHYSTNMYNSRV